MLSIIAIWFDHRGPNPGKSMWFFVILPPGSARHLSLPWLDHPLKLVCDVPHWYVLCIHSIFGNRRMPWVFCWLLSSKLYTLTPTPQPYHHPPPPNPHPHHPYPFFCLEHGHFTEYNVVCMLHTMIHSLVQCAPWLLVVRVGPICHQGNLNHKDDLSFCVYEECLIVLKVWLLFLSNQT